MPRFPKACCTRDCISGFIDAIEVASAAEARRIISALAGGIIEAPLATGCGVPGAASDSSKTFVARSGSAMISFRRQGVTRANLAIIDIFVASPHRPRLIDGTGVSGANSRAPSSEYAVSKLVDRLKIDGLKV